MKRMNKKVKQEDRRDYRKLLNLKFGWDNMRSCTGLGNV